MIHYFSQRTKKQRYLIAAGAGVLAALSLPPLLLLPLLYGGFCLLGLLSFSQQKPQQAFWEGMIFGQCYFGVGLYWIIFALLVEPQHHWLAPFALPLIASILALFIALPLWLVAKISGIWSRFFALVLLLSIAEWLRGFVFQFPWNNFSQGMGINGVLIQPLAVLGRDAYSFLTILSLLLIPLGLALPKKRLPLISFALAIPIIFSLWGAIRLDQAPKPNQKFFTNAGIRIVQPNIKQEDKINPHLAGENLTRLIDLSFKDLPGWVNHIIWPEVALHLNIDQYPQLHQDLGKLLPPGGVLITGTIRQHNKTFRNTAIAITDDGKRHHIHDKVTLVPFGEYSPLPFLNAIAGVQSSSFSQGEGLSNQSIGLLPNFSTLICYEVIFSRNVKPNGQETQWLLNLTNDGWFGQTTGPYQHAAMARWRAVEEGLGLVRAANTGISVVYDGYGRILNQQDLNVAGTLNIRVPKPIENRTYYSKNPYKIWVSLLVLCTILFGLSWFKESNPKLRIEL